MKTIKKGLFTLVVTAFITVSVLTGYLSSSEKTKSGEGNVQDIKVSVLDKKSDLNLTPKNSFTVIQQFKAEYEKRAAKIKTSFADAAEESKANEMKLAELEKRNRELKIKLADYIDEGIDKWQAFQLGFKRDTDELGKASAGLMVTKIK